MLFRDVIDLIGIASFEENELGDLIEVPAIPKQVFANKKSVRQSEFYQAQATGLKPELMFEIRSIEYNEEPKLSFNSKEYTIIRVFDKGELTEIVCQGVVNNG